MLLQRAFYYDIGRVSRIIACAYRHGEGGGFVSGAGKKLSTFRSDKLHTDACQQDAYMNDFMNRTTVIAMSFRCIFRSRAA